jgi:microcystin-dependent protein
MSEPAGIVMPFAGSVAPQGYLLCDGSAVSRTDYADLFAAIGTTYGAGDGSSTFNVPDLSGRVVLGVSQSHALGTTGGEATHVLTEQELPAHSHTVPAHGHANDITATTPALSHSITQPAFKYNKPNGTSVTTFIRNTHWGYTGSGATNASRAKNAAVADHEATACTVTGSVSDCDPMVTSAVGAGAGHNNLQPYQAIAYIICTGV